MNTSLPPGSSKDVWPDEHGREEEPDFPDLDFDDDERPSVQQAIEDSDELDGFNPGHLQKQDPEPDVDDDAWGTPAEDHWEQDDEHDDDWLDAEEEQQDLHEEAEQEPGLPMGLLVAAVVAVLLLGVGGYGVIQDRGKMQAEITELQAALADAVSPEEAQRLRDDIAAAGSETEQLQGELATARAEAGALRASLSELEQRLAQQPPAPEAPIARATPAAAATAPAAAKPATKPQPATAQKPAADPQPAATAMTGSDAGWFVNFSSYSQRAMADSWAARLKPSAGTVTISTVDNGGRTIYRLRVVGLESRQQAAQVARQLEQAHGLDSLWIGSQ